MVDRSKGVESLSSQKTDISLQYMAKNYAVNVMTLRQLSLIFEQQQQERPLSKEEIELISESVNKRLYQAEETVLADLYKQLDLATEAAVAAACKGHPAKE